MKKIVAIVLCALMLLSLAACGAKEADYKLGMGIVTNTDESSTGKAQIDATFAAVVTDKDGKIVSCRLDAVQNKISLADGAYTLDNLLTKMELGDNYNMATYGADMDMNGDGVVKEWYDQAKAFETYVVGMTASDVRAIETAENAHGSQMATDEKLLTAGCTIDIADFIEAVAKACEDEQAASFKSSGEFTLGVSADSFDDASTEATDGENGQLHVYSDFAAVVLDKDGKILAALNDAIQPKIDFDVAGEILGTNFADTKRCLKENYGMSTYGADQDMNGDGVVKEWFEQSAAFSAYVVGMTGDEVSAIATAPNAHNYMMATDEKLLSAGCTIQITSMIAVVSEAAANAR